LSRQKQALLPTSTLAAGLSTPIAFRIVAPSFVTCMLSFLSIDCSILSYKTNYSCSLFSPQYCNKVKNSGQIFARKVTAVDLYRVTNFFFATWRAMQSVMLSCFIMQRQWDRCLASTTASSRQPPVSSCTSLQTRPARLIVGGVLWLKVHRLANWCKT